MSDQNRRQPRNGELWRHFKGNLYKVWFTGVRNATNEANDNKEYVCYQPWVDNPLRGFYVREINEFMSEVDHVKYPEATQRYRFEPVENE